MDQRVEFLGFDENPMSTYNSGSLVFIKFQEFGSMGAIKSSESYLNSVIELMAACHVFSKSMTDECQ